MAKKVSGGENSHIFGRNSFQQNALVIRLYWIKNDLSGITDGMFPTLFKRPSTSPTVCALALLLMIASKAYAQETVATFALAENPAELVLSYSETPELIANADTTPRIRVYADGRVLVHYPVYMKKAGLYETYLSQNELNALISIATQLVSMSSTDIAAEANALATPLDESGGMIATQSDEVVERFEIHLAEYRAVPGATPIAVSHSIQWSDIKQAAAQYPRLEAIQDLNSVRDAVRALLASRDLERVGDVAP